MGLVGVFGVIFIFTIGGSLQFVFLYYIAICFSFFLFLPLWAKTLKYLSMNKFMAIGNLFYIIHIIALYLIAQNYFSLVFLIPLAIISNILARATYWVPYNINFSLFVSKHHRGRQLSFLNIIISILGIIIPIVAAFIIAKFGFPVLYILAIAIFAISSFPIIFIPSKKETFSFGYFETFKKLFSKRHFHTNLAYFADGFQDYIGAVMWPIFIFLLLKGNYIDVGLISAGIVLVICILRYLIGEATDKFNKKKLIRYGSILYSIGFILKTIIDTGLHVFFVGIYHDFTSILFRTPFDVLTFEIAADEGHYIDEFTVLREMALNLGRVVVLFLGIVLLNFVSLQMLFLLGVFITMLTSFISKDEFHREGLE